MSTEKLHTEIRQEQIAQAALSLVSNDGMKKLSVANVARRVGIVRRVSIAISVIRTKSLIPFWT